MAMVKISQTQNPYFICKNITPITLRNYVQTNLFAIYLLNGRFKKGVDVRKFILVFWNLSWQDDHNIHDCGIYAIRHMESFQGGSVKYWSTGFEKKKVTYRFFSWTNINFKLTVIQIQSWITHITFKIAYVHYTCENCRNNSSDIYVQGTRQWY